VREALSELPHLLTSHLQLTLSELLVGVRVSVPLGVLAARSSRLGPVLLVIAGTIQTVPASRCARASAEHSEHLRAGAARK